jgi:Recombinase
MASGSDSLAAIARILNQEGFRGRKGYRVGKSAIEKILKNAYLLWSLPLAGTITRRQSPLPSLQKIFSIRHAQPYMVTHVPTQTAVVLPLTTFSPVEIVGVRFWAKKKRRGLSITIAPFQRGRHSGWGYVPEREIARLFEPAVKAVTLDEEIVEWLQEPLKESDSDKSSRRLSETRLIHFKKTWPGVKPEGLSALRCQI